MQPPGNQRDHLDVCLGFFDGLEESGYFIATVTLCQDLVANENPVDILEMGQVRFGGRKTVRSVEDPAHGDPELRCF